MPLGVPFDAEVAASAFHDEHERMYGYAYRTGEVLEFVNWKVTGLGRIERPRLEPPPPRGRGRPVGRRGVFAVYPRDDLPAGFCADGPVIIEEYGSTTVVEAGFNVEIDRLSNLVLRSG